MRVCPSRDDGVPMAINESTGQCLGIGSNLTLVLFELEGSGLGKSKVCVCVWFNIKASPYTIHVSVGSLCAPSKEACSYYVVENTVARGVVRVWGVVWHNTY